VRTKIKFKKDLLTLIDYVWHDEEKHYEENPVKDHIYLPIKRIAEAIGYEPSFRTREGYE